MTDFSVTLPPTSDSFWDSTPGTQTYYIGIILDVYDNVAETNESDNSSRGSGIDYKAVSIEEDRYESNISSGSAYDLSSNEQTWLSTLQGYARQGTADWYEIYANVSSGNQRIRVDCTFTTARAISMCGFLTPPA